MKDRKRTRRIFKILRITLITLCGLVIVAGISVYFMLHSYIGKVNLVTGKEKKQLNIVETQVKENSEVENQKQQVETYSKYESTKTETTQTNGHDITVSKILGNNEVNRESNASDTTVKEAQDTNKNIDKVEAVSEKEESNTKAKQSEEAANINEEATIKSKTTNKQTKTDTKEEKALAALQKEIKKNIERNEEIVQDSKIKNILLFGRYHDIENDLKMNSMVLLSINLNTRKITATNFYENIYLMIPGIGYDRLGTAFEYDDGQLLTDTLEANFHISIDHYIRLDYDNLISIIDAMGGITVEIMEEELSEINTSIEKINQMTGKEAESDQIETAGKQLLNGKQALAYSRSFLPASENKKGLNRQIELINAICKEFSNRDIKKMNDMLNLVLPEITTNFTEGEIVLQLISVPSYLKYNVVQQSIPIENSYTTLKIDGVKLLGIDFPKNSNELKQKLDE